MTTGQIAILVTLSLYPLLGLMLLCMVLDSDFRTGRELARKGAQFSPEEIGKPVKWLADRVKFFHFFWWGYKTA